MPRDEEPFELIGDGDEDRPRPRSRNRGPRDTHNLVYVLRIIRIVAWAGLFLVVGCGGLLFCGALRKAETAINEAAIAAVFSTMFIGLYILVRCVEGALDSFERLQVK